MVAARQERRACDPAGRFTTGWSGRVLLVALVVLVLSGWATGALLRAALGDGGTGIDLPAVRFLAGHRSPWLTATMLDLTRLGSTLLLLPIVVTAGVAAYRRSRSWAVMTRLALSLGGAIALYDLVKPLVGRPRPQVGQLVATATGYAFPSGHATQIAAVAVALAVVGVAFTSSRATRAAIWSAAALVSVTVGFSRVYLGVHWPTDVAAGLVLGAAWAGLCGSFPLRRGGPEGPLGRAAPCPTAPPPSSSTSTAPSSTPTTSTPCRGGEPSRTSARRCP